MVYVADATALLLRLGVVAMALSVVVVEIVTGAVYFVDCLVGVDPSVV